jgi:hypothetical protein
LHNMPRWLLCWVGEHSLHYLPRRHFFPGWLVQLLALRSGNCFCATRERQLFDLPCRLFLLVWRNQLHQLRCRHVLVNRCKRVLELRCRHFPTKRVFRHLS